MMTSLSNDKIVIRALLNVLDPLQNNSTPVPGSANQQ